MWRDFPLPINHAPFHLLSSGLQDLISPCCRVTLKGQQVLWLVLIHYLLVLVPMPVHRPHQVPWDRHHSLLWLPKVTTKGHSWSIFLTQFCDLCSGIIKIIYRGSEDAICTGIPAHLRPRRTTAYKTSFRQCFPWKVIKIHKNFFTSDYSPDVKASSSVLGPDFREENKSFLGNTLEPLLR